jgi:hypothetical protein
MSRVHLVASLAGFFATALSSAVYAGPPQDILAILRDQILPALEDQQARIADLEATVAELEGDLADSDGTITDLEADVATLSAELSALSGNSVLALDGYVYLDDSVPQREKVVMEGVNLQVINGLGSTNSYNARGNIIIGYDESQPAHEAFCSLGQYTTEIDCVNNAEIWDSSLKIGSHNLVLGEGNNYTVAGGIVSGVRNVINGPYSNAVGGRENVSSAYSGTTVGGFRNAMANGANYSVMAGGAGNFSDQIDSFMAGGAQNQITGGGVGAAAIGGRFNILSGSSSVIAGGENNQASSLSAVVTGGNSNVASGERSTVSGGLQRSAVGEDDWVAGALFQDF